MQETAAHATRVRIVNGGELFALRVSVDGHRLQIISTDGLDTEALTVDSVILHLGERYDAVLVPRDEMAGDGNFFVRAQTLEGDTGAQVLVRNEVLAVLRYNHAPNSTIPTTSEHVASDAVVLNCFDVATPSSAPGSTCLPVTALRTHSSHRAKFDTLLNDPQENHEVAFAHSRGAKQYGHYTRVRSNVHDSDAPSSSSHREGAFTQFVLPAKPTMYSDLAGGAHNHSVFVDVTPGNTVQMIWNHQAPTAHPMHIHGCKLGPVVSTTRYCGLLACCWQSHNVHWTPRLILPCSAPSWYSAVCAAHTPRQIRHCRDPRSRHLEQLLGRRVPRDK